MCESLNCFCVKKNATVGFTGPAAKVMKFKIAHVHEIARAQAHARTMHIHIVYSNVGRLFCTPAPPKFTKKLAVDSFFNFGS